MMELKALNVTSEERFIILSCRQAVNRCPTEAIDALIEQGLDWTSVESIIRLHGLAGLVNSALARSHHLHNVPDGVLRHITLAGRQTAFKNLLYIREFAAILKTCNREHIQVVPLKGIAFLTSLYSNNTALRALTDIDILVKNKDVESVNRILLARGYQQKEISDRDTCRAFHAIYRRRDSSFNLLVEVHWDVDFPDSPYAIDIAESWQRSHEVKDAAGIYYEFSIEDSLIFNCFHILRNPKKGPNNLLYLKNFCDIAALILRAADSIDWECLIARSTQYKVVRPVGLVLLLVRELLGVTEIPAAIFEALRKEGLQDSFAACAVRQYIFNPPESDKKNLPFWITDLATATTFREKITAIKELPQVLCGLYRSWYYGKLNRSTLRTFLHIVGHYARKVSFAITLWIRAPRKTTHLQKNLIKANRETKTVLAWLRNYEKK